MQTANVVLFWICAVGVLYTYAGYPIVVWCMAHLVGRRARTSAVAADRLPQVSLVIIAHNERKFIEQRLRNALTLDYPRDKLQIIVVSDGSTDGTPELAGSYCSSRLRVIQIPQRSGKAAALSTGCLAASGEVIVLSDCRQVWARDALARLVENFADESVGAVSGELIIQSSAGVVSGVGLYWRFEKFLRRLESRIHSAVGVSGSICAVRRSLFAPIPAGTILDDVYWPMRVAMSGYRVVHDERAHAYDRLPQRSREEFRRKVRTLAGNFQLLARLPRVLLPWRNPIWVQFISHKVMRLIAPWALGIMLMTSAMLHAPIYRMAFACQVALYMVALAGVSGRFACRFRPSAAAASFVLLNAAAWVGFWVWVAGRSSRSWTKTQYQLDAAQ